MNSKKTDSEKLFYKLILQFSIYTRGSNQNLDPHLVNISKHLKQGSTFQQLSPELNALSKTLAQISNLDTQPKNSADSFKEQSKYFINRLKKFLLETDLPPDYQQQCVFLKKKITANIENNNDQPIIDAILAFLSRLKDHAISEQKEIEVFLVDITSQLDLLEEHAFKASKSNKQAIENTSSLTSVIDLQVENIKDSSINATELPSLQQNINKHLKELNKQLHQYRETEDSRQLQSQKQLIEMTEKLQEMEIETQSLRNNLKIAHDNAFHDSLTGLPNRSAYDERIALEVNRSQRYKNPLTLVIWDIDFFKLINDKFGHKAGDKTLALVAQLINSHCRITDFVARYGGEEFVMLLPNTELNKAFDLSEKIRTKIANSGFNHSGESIKITISAGISQFLENDDIEKVFERADKGLYLSKEQGRNKCTIN